MAVTSPIPPPFLSSRILVFSDFNCPYCYALNEWITDIGATTRVRWVGIEHRPDLPVSGQNAAKDSQLLDVEVSDVMSRDPALKLNKPRVWVNSQPALLVQNAIEDDAPELAPALRRLLFQSYWREECSLSDENAIEHTLLELELELPDREPDYLGELTDWWRTHLDRIPVMIAPTRIAHLGLQDKASVRRFLNSALRESTAGPGCK